MQNHMQQAKKTTLNFVHLATKVSWIHISPTGWGQKNQRTFRIKCTRNLKHENLLYKTIQPDYKHSLYIQYIYKCNHVIFPGSPQRLTVEFAATKAEDWGCTLMGGLVAVPISWPRNRIWKCPDRYQDTLPVKLGEKVDVKNGPVFFFETWQ